MPVLHDYKCNECGTITESIGNPQCSKCGSRNTLLVFCSAPQIRTQHASTVKHVMEQNRKKMGEIYDEDSAHNSDAWKNWEELAYGGVIG
jgi:predicted ATP-dependent serine protease